ncbi:MAG: UDP-N-acetylmuramate--L-alanine ligase [Planctomycetaceae bacterium]|nr:UDP-N-acetylmuramate--L-alanine ligase [Planctomycetaceae bacterium]
MEGFCWTKRDNVRVRFDRSPCAHLVGAAGSGMRSLADVLVQCGWRVQGSDGCSDDAALLAAAGVRWFHGHDARWISPEVDVLAYSDAVPTDNPERRRAAQLGIPERSYFQWLGRLSAAADTVAVAGTHGKSTTTAMTAHVLIEAGKDPAVCCGATPLGKTSGGRAGWLASPLSGEAGQGGGRLLVVEACEYRANFLNLRPRCAAILGIEPDHFDCYPSLAELENAFRRFAASVPADGFLLVRRDCPSTRRATEGFSCRTESFGLCPDADWSACDLADRRGCFGFEIRRAGRPFCRVRLRTPGRHNVLNALAAAALASRGGATPEQIAAGLSGFTGLHRRLEVLGTWRGATWVDDYAHHPTEVSAALAAVRRMFPGRRVWCVFQPHQASRTARLLDELAASLQNADRVFVTEIFRAREGSPHPGEVAASDLARRASELGVHVLPGHREEEILKALETGLAADDVLVTLGAGRRSGAWEAERRGRTEAEEKNCCAACDFAATDRFRGQTCVEEKSS